MNFYSFYFINLITLIGTSIFFELYKKNNFILILN
jgi:hypothetical protein